MEILAQYGVAGVFVILVLDRVIALVGKVRNNIDASKGLVNNRRNNNCKAEVVMLEHNAAVIKIEAGILKELGQILAANHEHLNSWKEYVREDREVHRDITAALREMCTVLAKMNAK